MSKIKFFCVAVVLVLVHWQSAYSQGRHQIFIERGQYVFIAAGCMGCHTDVKNKGPLLAGGRKLETAFGIFYGPNITPDKTYGIGKWSNEDFIRALRKGIAPNGNHYFPVFPYTSFTKMTTQDMQALKDYIFSVPPIAKPNKPHEVRFPFNIRLSMVLWKKLFFDKEQFRKDADRSEEWNRGAYLAQALAHCGECHTPRNYFGAVENSTSMAGSRNGPDGKTIPNITPDFETGIGKWSHKEIVEALKLGILPNGDFVGGIMTEVSNNMAELTRPDLNAIATYLKSLPAIRNKVTNK